MSRIPPIDLHAHIRPDIAPSELTALESLVFAATRSLAEAEQVSARADPWTIWGVGCHPGLARAQKAFSSGRFCNLIATTPSVNEVGLDGTSRVPIARQLQTFEGILDVLQDNPRITSIHSTGATQSILDSLQKRPIRGAVLHWWLGDEEQTRRAVGMGCYFSVNSSMLRHNEILDLIPPDRVLTETDHPFGDRQAARPRRPGSVADVESALARRHDLPPGKIRQRLWSNLADLVASAGCAAQLPRQIRVLLAST